MRLKKVLFGACMVSLFAFSISACSGNKPEFDNTIVTSDTTIVPKSALPNAVPATHDTTYKAPTSRINFETVEPVNVDSLIKVPTQTISAKSSVALNPAHGKPGHRCDLEVGAPLNSSPKVANQQNQQLQPAIPNVVQSSQPKLTIPLPQATV